MAIPTKPTTAELLTTDPLYSILKYKVPVIVTSTGTIPELVNRKIAQPRWQITTGDMVSGSFPIVDPSGVSGGSAIYSGPGRPTLFFAGAAVGFGFSPLRSTIWSYSAVFKPVLLAGQFGGPIVVPINYVGADNGMAGICMTRAAANGSSWFLGVYRSGSAFSSTLALVDGHEYAAVVTMDDSGGTKVRKFFLYDYTTSTLVSASGGTAMNDGTTNAFNSGGTDLMLLGNPASGYPFQGYLADAAGYGGGFDDTLFSGYVADPWSVARGSAYTSSSGTLTAGDIGHGCSNRTTVYVGAMRPTGGTTPYSYQWSRATKAQGTFAAISGATSLRLADNPPDDGEYWYKLVATDSAGTPATVTYPVIGQARQRKETYLYLSISDSIDSVGGIATKVENHLDKALYATGRYVNQHRRAVSGSATASWLPADVYLPGAIASIKADATVLGLPWDAGIVLGANDSITASAYETNVRAIIAELMTQGCRKVFLHLPTFQQNPFVAYEINSSRIEDYHAKLITIAGDTANVILGDTISPGISLAHGNNLSGWHPFADPSVRIGLARGFAIAQALDGVGSYTAASNVRSGTDRGDGTVGTLTVPSLANTKIGVAGDGGTGTYDGSDRWTDPGVANVKSAVAYKAGSTTNNRTGTVTLPTAGQVQTGVTYGSGGTEFTGSLSGGAGATLSQIQSELDTRGLTGTFSSGVGTKLDTVAGYLDTEVAAILAKVNNLPSDPADASDIASAFGSITTTLTAIKAKTDSIAEIGVVGTVTGSPTATVIQGVGTALVSTNYTSGMLAFTSGPNKGLAKRITAYNSGTKTFTVSPAFPDTPASGDTFVVLGNKEAS